MVELVSRNDDALSPILVVNDLDPVLDIWTLAALTLGVRIDADRELLHIDESILELNPLRSGFNIEETATCLQKVMAVFFSLESNEVRSQNTFEKRRTDSSASENPI